MDRSAFHQVLVPELARAGLQGTYLNKAGTVKEGEAIFFSASKWRQAAQKDLEMRQCFSPAALAPGPCLYPRAATCSDVDALSLAASAHGDTKQRATVAMVAGCAAFAFAHRMRCCLCDTLAAHSA